MQADVEAGPAWTAGAVARHLGIATSTLRTWNRRYGIGPAEHHAGRHRSYSPADVARLRTMVDLVTEGVAPAAAARWVQTSPAATARAEAVPPRPSQPNRAVAGLLAAALRLDGDGLLVALRAHLNTHGVQATWEQVCVGVLTEVGHRFAADGSCVDAEHLLSWTITTALRQVPMARPTGAGQPALLACVEDEQHTLALDALRAALAERGVPVRMLGAALPAAALCGAITRLAPASVVLWAQTVRTARPGIFGRVAALPRTPGLVIAAGAGWDGRRLPAGVQHPATLADAMRLTCRAPGHDRMSPHMARP